MIVPSKKDVKATLDKHNIEHWPFMTDGVMVLKDELTDEELATLERLGFKDLAKDPREDAS